MRKLLFIGLSLLLFNAAVAQSFLEGNLKNEKTDTPISSANIYVKNQLNGTVSNDEGKFKISLVNFLESDSIIISHINYYPVYLTIRELKSNNGQVKMQESHITLEEVYINPKEDDALLDELITQSKSHLRLPFIGRLYYREWVKENNSYNRFADGLLDVIYGTNDKDLAVRVDQSRAYKLPKDDDEIFEMASPVKMENVLNNQYINFLNRFGNEKKSQYHFYAFQDSAKNGGTTLIVEPKKVKLKEGEDRVFYRALIKADSKKNITEAILELDSMSNYDKNILGLHMKVLNSKMTFRFINQNNINYLSYFRAAFTMQFTFRKKIQVDNYTSEFLLLSASPQFQDIPKDQRFKKSSLYKNGTKFTKPYWEELNMPLASHEEAALLEEIKNKH